MVEISRSHQPEISRAAENLEGIQPVARAWPYSMRAVDWILADLKTRVRGVPSLVSVYLTEKTDTSLPSKGLLMPYGGKMLPGEHPKIAAVRELKEESTIVVVPFKVDKDETPNPNFFDYEINAYKGHDGKKRRVYFEGVRVISPFILQTVHPKQEETKIKTHISLRLESFKEIVKTGVYRGKTFAASISKIKVSTGETIDEENMKKRNAMLDGIIEEMEKYQDKITKKLTEKLISVSVRRKKYDLGILRSLKNLEGLGGVLYHLRDTLAEKEFEQLFKEAYNSLILEEYTQLHLQEERKQKPQKTSRIFSDKPPAEKRREQKVHGETERFKKYVIEQNAVLDIFSTLPFYSILEGVEVGKYPHALLSASRFIRNSVRAGIKKEGFIWKDFVRFYTDSSISLGKKIRILESINISMVHFITEQFGFSQQEIFDAWGKAKNFIRALEREIKTADSKFYDLYQLHDLLNEIATGSISEVILYAAGLIHDKPPQHQRGIRFESLRQLLLFTKILFAESAYKEKTIPTTHPIAKVLNEYFHQVVNTKIESIGTEPGKAKKKAIERRRDKAGRIIIVDAREPKSWPSFIRKSFEESAEQIQDIHSVNFVLPNQEYGHLDFEQRVVLITNIKNNFFSFIQEQFPDWEFAISESKNTYENYRIYTKQGEIKTDGKRTGSQSGKIIREKMYVRLTSPDKKISGIMELSLYPFESLREKGITQQACGWREKIEDDSEYVVNRLLDVKVREIIEGGRYMIILGGVSPYTSLVPSSIYPETVDQVRNRWK